MQQERRRARAGIGAGSDSNPDTPRDLHASRAADSPLPPAARTVRLHATRTEPSEHLFRRLLGAYLQGAADIEVVERPRLSKATRNVVQAFCHRTVGPEVAADDGRILRLSDSALSGLRVSLPKRIGHLGSQVAGLHRRAVDQWTELPLRDEALWEALDDPIDREAWFLQRAIVMGRTDARALGDSIGWWRVTHALERIGDYGVLLGQAGTPLSDIGPGSSTVNELRQFHAQALRHLEEALAVESGEQANDLLDVGEALLASGRSIAEWLIPAVGHGSMLPGTAVTIERVLSAVEGTVRHTQEVAHVFLDLAFGGTGVPEPRPPLVVLAP